MNVPNIPAVVTSIVDKSFLAPVFNAGRSVLIPFFSKYGVEEMTELYDVGEAKYKLGEENNKKYGNSMKYLLNVLSLPNVRVIGKRLLPADAYYANMVVHKNGETTEIKSNATISDSKLVLKTDDIISFYGSGRGAGYKNIHIKFQHDLDMELFYSDELGNPLYKFNFLKAVVYEKRTTGFVELASDLKFSLIDIDTKTDTTIVNPRTGKTLHVNDVFKSNNNFIRAILDTQQQDQINVDQNIDDLIGTGVKAPVIKEYDNGVFTNKYFRLVEIKELDNTTGKLVSKIKSVGVEKTDDDVAVDFIAVNNGGSGGITKVSIKRTNNISGVITFEDGTGETVTQYIVDGVTGFFELKLDDAGLLWDLESTVYGFFRHNVFNSLLNNGVKHQLKNGSDGSIVDANGRFVFSATVPTKNAKQLTMSFYKDTDDLKELLYPKYDIDYIPDTQNDQDIMQSISNLTSLTGTSLALLSLPHTINWKDDIRFREIDFYASNMHAALYSGQWNTNHYDSATNKRISLPLSYYALYKHLEIDNTISITEPVANIFKGQMPVAGYRPSYSPTSEQIEKLREKQINTIISEPDGIYLIDQFTAYKRNSKLSRINNIKTLHKIRKELPKLLKDLLQLKNLTKIQTEAVSRVEKYMTKWEVREDNLVDGIFETIEITPKFDDASNTLYLYITVTFVGIIERINIPIIVK